jgi:thiamine-monophosphate kinase
VFKREDDFVRWLGRRMGTAGRGLTLGIGDDAALVRPSPGRELILTSDWTIEDVHFRLKLHPPDAVGHRALARALSDVAAMGGRPRWAVVSLAISKSLPDAWVKRFYRGMLRLARRFDVAIVGGDTSVVPDRISIDIVVVGEVLRGQALRRSGARPGDQIFVSGGLGLSALGLKLLESGSKTQTRQGREALLAHLYPEPQCALGEFLARRKIATAMMDISDGLSTDLARLCRASGVGAHIWESLLPMSSVAAIYDRRRRTQFAATTDVAGAERSSAAGRAVAALDPLALALHGGEDYQLLFTVPERAASKLPLKLCGVPLCHVGVIDPGNTIRLIRASGKVESLKPAGFDHFRGGSR